MNYFLFIVCFASVAVAQCGEINSQIAQENRAALGLASRFTGYEIDHPGIIITSLVQVLEITNVQQLIPEEDSFRAYGTNAGFENSILEKYVFMPPGVMVEDSIGGEVVLMSAQPFPSGNGDANRAVVAKRPNRYRGFILPESRVQRMIAAAGVEIPKPERTEPIPRPPPQKDPLPQTWEETLKMFPGLAKQLGLDTNQPLPQPKGNMEPSAPISPTNEAKPIAAAELTNNKRWLISLIFAVMATLGIYFWRRNKRQN